MRRICLPWVLRMLVPALLLMRLKVHKVALPHRVFQGHMGAAARAWVVVLSDAPIKAQSERRRLIVNLVRAARIAPCVTGRFLVRPVAPMFRIRGV